jgi:hypothetical protein
MKYINTNDLITVLMREDLLRDGYLKIIYELSEEREGIEISLKEEGKESQLKCGLNQVIKSFSKFGSNSEDVTKRVKESEENYCTCGNPSEKANGNLDGVTCYDCRKHFKDEKVVTDNTKVNTYLLNRVEELEKELIDLKLKLKDLSK